MEVDGMKRGRLGLASSVGDLMLPGDEFFEPTDQPKLVLGPGLKLVRGSNDSKIVATKSGILQQLKGNNYFIENKAKQYDCFKKDDVVGIIKQKGKGEQYSIDVGRMKERAQLSKFAFEGATKRFRPDLQVGDVVYGKVVELPPDYPMELTCVHSSGKALGLGSLEGGHVFQVPVHFTRALRSPKDCDNVLKKIGKIVPCETAVGVNGLVWVKAKNAVYTLLVSQLIVCLSKSSRPEYDGILKQFRKGILTM